MKGKTQPVISTGAKRSGETPVFSRPMLSARGPFTLRHRLSLPYEQKLLQEISMPPVAPYTSPVT